MSSLKKARHATYHIHYHIVWVPKHRRFLLEGEVSRSLRGILGGIAAKKGWELHSVDIQPDHVHLAVSVPPQFAPSEIVKLFKGISARLLLIRYPDLARKSGRGTLWAPSYYIATAGGISGDVICQYIKECQDRWHP